MFILYMLLTGILSGAVYYVFSKTDKKLYGVVAAIAITLPVALVIAPYLNVAPEVVLFASLVVAGMPFLLLVGAAPNAIAYDSKQFSSGEFFKTGIPASVILLIILGLVVAILWPIMGMPITLTN